MTFIDHYEQQLVDAARRDKDRRDKRRAVVRRIIHGEKHPPRKPTKPGLFRRT